jgi:hypothetical protein
VRAHSGMSSEWIGASTSGASASLHQASSASLCISRLSSCILRDNDQHRVTRRINLSKQHFETSSFISGTSVSIQYISTILLCTAKTSLAEPHPVNLPSLPPYVTPHSVSRVSAHPSPHVDPTITPPSPQRSREL